MNSRKVWAQMARRNGKSNMVYSEMWKEIDALIRQELSNKPAKTVTVD